MHEIHINKKSFYIKYTPEQPTDEGAWVDTTPVEWWIPFDSIEQVVLTTYNKSLNLAIISTSGRQQDFEFALNQAASLHECIGVYVRDNAGISIEERPSNKVDGVAHHHAQQVRSLFDFYSLQVMKDAKHSDEVYGLEHAEAFVQWLEERASIAVAPVRFEPNVQEGGRVPDEPYIVGTWHEDDEGTDWSLHEDG